MEMGSQTCCMSARDSSTFLFPVNSSSIPCPISSVNPSRISLRSTTKRRLRFHTFHARAIVDEKDQISPQQITAEEEEPSREVMESVELLKNAAKTRKVPQEEILSAFSVIEKSKCDPSSFLKTLGGSESPGRTWMLVYTAKKKLNGGQYFPLTAVQRFDAVGKRIENGVYLGPLGALTFEGKISWKNRILSFIFERIRIKIGSLEPLDINLGKKNGDMEPSTKDPFFIWYYVDEEIAVARGKSGGTAFWVRCRRVDS